MDGVDICSLIINKCLEVMMIKLITNYYHS